ncbi:MAG: 3-phosphoshikimate 1-carboxyvinyltransferase [Bacteroidota bacterium]|nr:3-phosphoshikimate 1-carboxyvinyltransferase [Bacteroidota bacterium]
MIYHLNKYKDVEEVQLDLPGSKSLSNRFLILKALYPELSIDGLSEAEDTRILENIILQKDQEIQNVGAAGTAFRFALGYFAMTPGRRMVTGTDRLQKRPIAPLVDALRKLGARIDYAEREGYAPLWVEGVDLEGGEVEVDPSISSQFLTSLMLIAVQMKNGLTIRFNDPLVSRSYIEMTAWCLREIGAKVEIDTRWVRVHSLSSLKKKKVWIERDWTSASYWYSMVSLGAGPRVHLPGLWQNSPQGDSRQALWFEELGVVTRFLDSGITLMPTRSRLGSMRMDLDLHPDLGQTFAVLLAAKGVEFFLTGLKTLKFKESDRLRALQLELGKFGIETQIDDHSISSKGQIIQTSNLEVQTYDDHRMAMAFSVLSLLFPIRIKDPGVVVKSYPNFWEELEKFGIEILLIDPRS